MNEELNRSLRTSHRTVLAMIALCAVLSAIQPGDGDDDAPDPTTTSVAIALGIRAVIIESYYVPSGSMFPTLLIGDHVFVNKFIYTTIDTICIIV